MNKKDLYRSTMLLKEKRKITFDELLSLTGKAALSFECIELYIKKGFVNEEGDGIFVQTAQDKLIEEFIKENHIDYKDLSGDEIKNIAGKLDENDIGMLERIASMGDCRFSDLGKAEHSEITTDRLIRLFSCGLVKKEKGQFYSAVTDESVSAVKSAFATAHPPVSPLAKRFAELARKNSIKNGGPGAETTRINDYSEGAKEICLLNETGSQSFQAKLSGCPLEIFRFMFKTFSKEDMKKFLADGKSYNDLKKNIFNVDFEKSVFSYVSGDNEFPVDITSPVTETAGFALALLSESETPKFRTVIVKE